VPESELSGRALTEPALSRLPLDTPYRAEILALHEEAVERGEAG
jgi:hypothetical protein